MNSYVLNSCIVCSFANCFVHVSKLEGSTTAAAYDYNSLSDGQFATKFDETRECALGWTTTNSEQSPAVFIRQTPRQRDQNRFNDDRTEPQL